LRKKGINIDRNNLNYARRFADEVGVSRESVSDIITKFGKNGKIAEITKDFKPFIYNIWNTPKINNEAKHIKTPKETAPIMAIDLTKREQLIWILFGVIVIAVILFLMKDKIIPARLISSIKYG